MLSEIFQKPKPLIGTVQLLPLPGSTEWNGRFEPLFARAEQEAAALTSGGIDGILLENAFDTPHRLDRVDPASAIALAMVAQQINKFTNVPLGISVLRNDPETALAVAINVQAGFIRVPVLVGSVITDTGLAEGKLQSLAEYKNLLKPLAAPKIFADISLNHLVPGRIQSLMSGPQKAPGQQFVPADFLINHFKQVAAIIEHHGMAHALVLNGREIMPSLLKALKETISLPLFVEDPETKSLSEYYELADGLIFCNSIKKDPVAGMDPRPTVDMLKVEEHILTLRPQTFPSAHPTKP